MSSREPLYLIDGSAYIYRAYHAIRPLSNAAGQPTHAVYGFTTTLLRVIREKTPRYLAIAYDSKGPNFRHEIYPAYKANRPEMPADLACQIPYIKEVVSAYHITTLEQAGVEADDLIAAAARRLAGPDQPLIIVSGDKDLLQLVNEWVTLWDPMQDTFMDPAAVAKKYQVSPQQLLDYFALIGDSSDNVPGVPGVGPKTAAKLIDQFGSLEQLFANLEQVSAAKLREKLAAHRQDAQLARRLIRLKDDLELPTSLDDYTLPPPDQDKLRQLFTELEFTRLIKSELQAEKIAADAFQLINSLDQLHELVAILAADPAPLVIDTETTSLDPLQAELVGISLTLAAPGSDESEAKASRTAAGENGACWYLPIAHRREDGSAAANQLPLAEVRRALAPLLADDRRLKLGHNLKYDLQVLHRHDLPLAPPLADTMIASYLIDPSRRSHGLDVLSEELLQRRLTSFAEVTDRDRRPEAFAHVAPAAAAAYSCEDVAATRLLWQLFQPKLAELELAELFYQVEITLLPILARMERVGILLDGQVLKELAAEFSQELERLSSKIYQLAGVEFNINSPRQLGEVLFERLKLPHGRKTKGKTGYSTDIRELERLAAYHDLPAAIIAQRNLSKLKSTYVDKLSTLINPADGRIHTSFNQTVTATGRLSSSNPNLQNIPVRTQEGRRIRGAFIAAPGHRFLAADYSQIDLRVLAHYSADPMLLEAFQQDQDIHRRTAAEIFRVNPAMVTADMRRVAKTINFGIIYGMSAFGLAEQLRCSRKEAQVFIDRYFELYRGVKTFMEEIVEQARRDGFVRTLLKRRRQLPEINSSNKLRREFAERTAINTPIQGTAADIIKLAAIACDRELRRKNFNTEALLQIHDELIFEVPEDEQAAVGKLVQQAMENVMELTVPLRVNLKSGPNLAATE
ncbi:DNA polymerase I [Desulfurivibrio alkaliphilus]|uniref:DNA polymerase I n=1 Tax=Desulfurivibrio alkaliphilus (strain DSM 19089 / UNIQEM U267 / AHT2) TaxID=589865 RepID=D6Z501_DESAT|nr:DNA polymerase I [Desulfurivibrio alkaliphilus]ADH86626.1 DNA polymerase I [Desulfurivibrio alkaliphilus AHT 2]